MQDTPGELTREELRAEIRGLNDRQQAELGDGAVSAW